jgi:16S rRNA (guanine527-N7)-methyltransferase
MYGPAEFAAEFAVSRETMEALARYDEALLAAQLNLISRNTVAERWERHFRDSAQLLTILPEGRADIVDLGSGAGFPGLVLAAMGKEKGWRVTLVESIGKKARFLSETAAAMALDNVAVIPERIESITISPPDVITARALSSLVNLIGYAYEIADKNTVCIFPKGQDVVGELTEAAKYWHMDVEQSPSITNAQSTILVCRNLRPRAGSKPARGGSGKPGASRKR